MWYIIGTVIVIVLISAIVIYKAFKSIFNGIDKEEKAREEFRHL